MGMLIHHTWMNQQKQKDAPVEEANVDEQELPFTDPEEPAEEPVKKTVRKTTTRRRKSSGK